MALAELRLDGAAALGATTGSGVGGGAACSLPQCSLLAPAGLRCASDRLLDGEQGLLRIQRRNKVSSARSATRRVVEAAKNAPSDEEVTKSGTKKLFKLPGTLKLRNKDTNVVFVAGATGKVGSRTVKELVNSGLRVRAGVRSIEKAEIVLGETVSSITGSSPWDKILGFFGLKKDDQLQIIDCDLESSDDIELAIGNAGIVICTIGASEKEVLDVTGPYRIDYEATKNLIEAAKNADVKRFILVTSLGTTKFGLPASVLNLFWGVLIWKAKAEKSLVDSGLSYTIVRPGGMERPTDAFKETHNLRLAPKDTFSGGQVSRLQVAELLACIANNLELAEDKIVEAIAETSAPLRPIADLLEEIPSQSRKDEPAQKASAQAAEKRKKAAAALAKAEDKQKSEQQSKRRESQEEAKRKAAEAKKAQDEAKRKAIEAKKAQELRQRAAAELSELKQEEAAAVREAESIQKKRLELAEKAQEAAEAAAKAEAVAKALLTAAKEGRVLSEADKRKILEAESKKVLQLPKISTKTEVATPERPKALQKAAPAKITPVKPKPKADEDIKVPVEKPPAPKAKDAAMVPSKKKTEAATVPKITQTPPAETKAPEKLGTKPASKKKTEAATAPKTTQTPPAETKAPEKLGTKPASKIPTRTDEKAAKVGAAAKTSEKTEEVDKPVEETKPEPVPVNETPELVKEESEPKASFRWFWEQDETEPQEATRPPETEAAAPEADETSKPAPSPASAAAEVIEVPSEAPETPPTAKVTEVPGQEPETPPTAEGGSETGTETAREREEAALLKAKASLAFNWPWQKESTEETPSSGKTEKAAVAETESSPVEEKTEETENGTAKELSSGETEKKTKADTDTNGAPTSIPTSNEIEEPVEPEAAKPSADSPAQEEAVLEVEKKLDTDAAQVKDEEKPDTEAAQFDPQKVKNRELDSLAKAKAATSFVWPWKGTETAKEQADDAKEKIESIQEEPEPVSSRPLAPYPSYADWKPPASPSPPPPKIATAEGTTSSETPAEVKPVETTDDVPDASDKKKLEEFTASMVKEREQAALAMAKAALAWKWADSVDNVKINSQALKTSIPSIVPEKLVAPSRPLSPYYRYEDLKPPTSPMPRPPTFAAVAKETPQQKTPQTSSAGVGDVLPADVVDEAAEEAKARAAEALEKAKASVGIKWPWS